MKLCKKALDYKIAIPWTIAGLAGLRTDLLIRKKKPPFLKGTGFTLLNVRLLSSKK